MKSGVWWVMAFALLAKAPAAAQESTADADHASERLSKLMTNHPLELTYHGRTVRVVGRIEAGARACTPYLIARGHGKTREWKRILDFTALAWAGEQVSGTLSLVFYNPVSHLAGDVVSVKDGATGEVNAAALDLAQVCQAQALSARPVMVGSAGASRSCHFPRLPGLTLAEGMEGSADLPRAMLTLLSRQSPAGELTLLVEGTALPQARTGWGRTSVAFVFADANYKTLGVTTAALTLDGQMVEFKHSLVQFGDTRVRVATDASGATRHAGAGEGYFERLSQSRTATLTLLDSSGQPKRRLDFDLAGKLASARSLLDNAGWSCAGASPAVPPPARWHGLSD